MFWPGHDKWFLGSFRNWPSLATSPHYFIFAHASQPNYYMFTASLRTVDTITSRSTLLPTRWRKLTRRRWRLASAAATRCRTTCWCRSTAGAQRCWRRPPRCQKGRRGPWCWSTRPRWWRNRRRESQGQRKPNGPKFRNRIFRLYDGSMVCRY